MRGICSGSGPGRHIPAGSVIPDVKGLCGNSVVSGVPLAIVRHVLRGFPLSLVCPFEADLPEVDVPTVVVIIGLVVSVVVC